MPVAARPTPPTRSENSCSTTSDCATSCAGLRSTADTARTRRPPHRQVGWTTSAASAASGIDARAMMTVPVTIRPDDRAGSAREGDTLTVIDWLLDADPAIRWQVMRDLTHEPADVVAAERSRVATEGWGARLLALQAPDGLWGGNAVVARLDGHVPRPGAPATLRARSRERAGPAGRRPRPRERHLAGSPSSRPPGPTTGSSRARSSRASTATSSRPARTSVWT